MSLLPQSPLNRKSLKSLLVKRICGMEDIVVASFGKYSMSHGSMGNLKEESLALSTTPKQ